MPTGGAPERLFACTPGVDKSPRPLRAKAHGRMAGAPLWFDTLDELRILSGGLHSRASSSRRVMSRCGFEAKGECPVDHT
jgi:hypothetical protein